MLLNTTECLVAKCNLSNNTGTGIHLERSSSNVFSQKQNCRQPNGWILLRTEGSNNTLIENLIAEKTGETAFTLTMRKTQTSVPEQHNQQSRKRHRTIQH